MNAATHILLVDDEPRFAQSLQQILLAHDYPSTIASNGEEALKLLDNKIFDLILLDVDLPDMSGVQVIDYVRKSIENTPIIMLTGNATVETAVEAMKKGAYDYLKKPIIHDLLTTTIEKALHHFQLEKELKDSEGRFQTLSNASWEGVMIHNKGLLIEANNQFFDMFGYRKEELIRTNILKRVFSEKSYHQIIERVNKDIIGSHEAVGINKLGFEFPLETRSSHIDFQGQRLRVCVVRDITDRKKAEEEKLKLQLQLAKASKMEALGLMAGSVAHDLNNILASIVSYPEVLLMEMDQNNKHRDSIKTIQDAGKRAASVVSDLITIARGTTTPKTVKNANTIIKKYLNTLEHKDIIAHHPDVVIRTHLAKDLLNMLCSEIHLAKVLMNLIYNAIEAIDGQCIIDITTDNIHLPEPKIAYETIDPGDYVRITLADNGPGIAPKDIDHIFEPFYTKKVMGNSGTGLGLAIVWSTIHDHNGYINLSSGYKGTVFELYFPSTVHEEFIEDKALSINAIRGSGEKILIVDDQETQCLITRNMLNNIGYDAVSVNSGKMAVRACQNTTFDLIILDMILEDGMNGRETYEEIQKSNPSQKAIVISGFSESEEIELIKKLGVSHFVKKPYTLNQIGMVIKQALNKASSK